MSENAATQRQYVTQLTLSAALGQAIRTLWTSITPTASEASWAAFSAATHAVVPQFAQAASVTSLDNYRMTRLSAGVADVPRLPRITPPPAPKVDAGLAWAKRAADQIEAEQSRALAEIEATILGRVDAAMQKVLMDEARETTIEAVEGDDKALGFRRVPRPDACAWCITLAIRKTTRGGLAVNQVTESGRAKSLRRSDSTRHDTDEHWGVFKSRALAGQAPEGAAEINRFHNNCNCVVEPIFDASFVVPSWLQDYSDLYDETDGGLNGFRRALNAQRGGEPAPDPRPELPAPSIQPTRVAAIADLLSGIDAAMRAA